MTIQIQNVAELMADDPKSIATWQDEVHAMATAKGWWDGYERADGRVVMSVDQILAKLALIHSEVSEALEDVRVGKMERTGHGAPCDCRQADCSFPPVKPEGFPTELADVVIRCLDLAGAMGIDLEGEIRTKVRFNATRPIKHGGKLA